MSDYLSLSEGILRLVVYSLIYSFEVNILLLLQCITGS